MPNGGNPQETYKMIQRAKNDTMKQLHTVLAENPEWEFNCTGSGVEDDDGNMYATCITTINDGDVDFLAQGYGKTLTLAIKNLLKDLKDSMGE